MESTQRALVGVLLQHVFSLGLISQFTYSKAEDLVYSVRDFPELFRYPVCLTGEEGQHGCAQDPE